MTSPRAIGPVRFGPGAEFDLIRRLVDPADLLPMGVSLGPGDDAAVLEGDGFSAQTYPWRVSTFAESG